MSESFTKGQRRTFILCFACYCSAYIGRLNLSAALGELSGEFEFSDARAGMLQTVFALVYAAGQVVNGSLIDRISARRYIAIGLLSSAACNALFGMAQSYPILLILWALNGAAQSMLWTPVVKLMTVWFRGARRDKASFGLSLTMIIGHLAAWAASGALAAVLSWRYAFFVSAAVVALAGIAGLMLLRDAPNAGDDIGEATHSEGKACAACAGVMPIDKVIGATGLYALMMACVCNGFVRDGITTWAPTILSDAAGGMALDSAMTMLIIPAINAVGIITVRRIYGRFSGSARLASGVLLAFGGVLAFLLMPIGMPVSMCAVLMGLCCAMNYGINPMLTTLIPMEYENVGRVGMVAGLMDCFIYLGSALAGTLTGALSDGMGWRFVYAAWGCASLFGAALSIMSVRGKKNISL